MLPLIRPWIVAPLLAGFALAPAAASGQVTDVPPELRQLATRLTAAVPAGSDGPVRLALIPLADGPVASTISVAAEVTERLRSALVDAVGMADHRIDIDIVDTTEIDRAARELQIAQPLGTDGAVLVGILLDADYVVLGSIERLEEGEPARISVELLEVATRRRRQTATVALNRDQPDRVEAPSPGISSRRLLINGGFVAAAAASLMAVMKERQVRLSRGRLLEVPAGAQEEWNLEFEQARRLQDTRNLWLGAAIGAGGATLAYMLISGGTDEAPRAQRGIRLPLPGEWSLRVNPVAPGVSLAGAF